MSKDKYEVRKIKYTKDSGDVSEREVIIMSEPHTNVMAIDLSGLSAEQVKLIQDELREHAESMKALGVAWKSFKPNNLQFI